jgi:hypothetical protein
LRAPKGSSQRWQSRYAKGMGRDMMCVQWSGEGPTGSGQKMSVDVVAHDYLALKDATWGGDYWWERANSDERGMHKILDREGWERTEVESGRIGGSHGPTTGVSAAHSADGNGRGDWLR